MAGKTIINGILMNRKMDVGQNEARLLLRGEGKTPAAAWQNPAVPVQGFSARVVAGNLTLQSWNDQTPRP
jgi:hypothetical protein